MICVPESKQTGLIKCHTDISNNDSTGQIPLVSYTCQEKRVTEDQLNKQEIIFPPDSPWIFSFVMVPGSFENQIGICL